MKRREEPGFAANAPRVPGSLASRYTAVLAPRLRAAVEWLKGGVRRPRRFTPMQSFVVLLAAGAVIGVSRFTWYPWVLEAIRSRHGVQAGYDFDDLFLLFMFLVMLSPTFLLHRGSLPRWLVLTGWVCVLGSLLLLAAKQVPALTSAIL